MDRPTKSSALRSEKTVALRPYIKGARKRNQGEQQNTSPQKKGKPVKS